MGRLQKSVEKKGGKRGGKGMDGKCQWLRRGQPGPTSMGKPPATPPRANLSGVVEARPTMGRLTDPSAWLASQGVRVCLSVCVWVCVCERVRVRVFHAHALHAPPDPAADPPCRESAGCPL